MKRIIITGATSMIGTAIIDEALKHDPESIYAVVRRGSKKLYRLAQDSRIHIVECDINNYEELPRLIPQQCDTFYHIAWNATGTVRNKSIQGQSQNIIYTLQALHAANELGCSKFIGAGSQAEYGKIDIDKIGPDTPANPIQAYGVSKYAAGKLVQMEAERLGISCIWVRIFSVYGKYDRETTMIASSIRKMLNHEPTAFTAGIQRWDYLNSEDAGRAFYIIGEKVSGNKVYCVGSGTMRPLYEYIEEMRDEIDPSLEMGLGQLPYNDATIMNLCADISALVADTGWQPQINFRQGIRQYIELVKRGGYIRTCLRYGGVYAD